MFGNLFKNTIGILFKFSRSAHKNWLRWQNYAEDHSDGAFLGKFWGNFAQEQKFCNEKKMKRRRIGVPVSLPEDSTEKFAHTLSKIAAVCYNRHRQKNKGHRLFARYKKRLEQQTEGISVRGRKTKEKNAWG